MCFVYVKLDSFKLIHIDTKCDNDKIKFYPICSNLKIIIMNSFISHLTTQLSRAKCSMYITYLLRDY